MATPDSQIDPVRSNQRVGGGSRGSNRSWPETARWDDRSILDPVDGLLSALENVAGRADAIQVLKAMCDWLDSLDATAIATAFLADQERVHLIAGRRVPRERSEAVALLATELTRIASRAMGREPVIFSDFARHASFSEPPSPKYRELALAHGFGAAWLQPIVAAHNELLGVMVVFHGRMRTPEIGELRLLKAAGQIALIAIDAERLRSGAPEGSTQRPALEDPGSVLRLEEQEWRSLIDEVPQQIIIFEQGGIPVYANRSMREYTGLSLEEMKGGGFFHAEDVERLRENRRDALTRGTAFENEQRILGRDGQYRWFLIRYNPLHDQVGRGTRWYATGTDIDNRRQAEESTRNENLALREEIDRCSMFEEIIGSSLSLRRVLAHVEKVARADSTVLISGETGTGKELIARAIHRQSARSAKPFIRVNCAAIPPSLIASELFGHEKGAFTGAMQRRLGRFEAAHGGTILLDEVGELPAEAQVALLRVLQEREIERVGSNHTINVDVRVLAATNRDLDEAVEQGTFRRDLYYRLNVFPIRVPSLRERVDDIPLLVEYLVDRYARKAGKKIRIIARSTLDLLQAYHWPGNIRELQNVVERAVVLCEGDKFLVDRAWLTSATGQVPSGGRTLADSEREMTRREREMIEAALAESRGRIAGPSGAAARLGIPRQTLDGKIQSLRIDKYKFRNAALGNHGGSGGGSPQEPAE